MGVVGVGEREEMAQWEKWLPHKPSDLSSIPRIHNVFNTHTYTHTHMHTHTYAHTHTHICTHTYAQREGGRSSCDCYHSVVTMLSLVKCLLIQIKNNIPVNTRSLQDEVSFYKLEGPSVRNLTCTKSKI